MDKFIKIYHEYESKEVERLCYFIDTGKILKLNSAPSGLLWVIGKKIWGKKFIDREYELRST